MAENSGDKKSWLPKVNFNKRHLTKQIRQVEGATLRHTRKFIFKRLGNVREAQRHIIIWVSIVVVLITATGLQLMWFRQNYKMSTGALNGVYAEAVQGPIDTLNPLFAKTSAEQSASYLMFSRLVNYDKTGHLNYDLATDITTNEAKTVYTVKMRDNVVWSDGLKMTADDIAFTIELIKNPNTRTTIDGWDNTIVKVIDDYTMQFSISTPYSAFEHTLNFPIVPKHSLAEVTPSGLRESQFSSNPVGSGPFKFSFIQDIDKTSGRKIVYMNKNESYYKGIAKINRFQLNVYGSNEEIKRAITSGEVNAATDLYPADITNIDKNKYDIESNPVSSGVYAILNVKSAMLQDIALRRALQVGTNVEAVRSELPTTTPALDLPITNSQLFGDVPRAPKYDLVAAGKILDDAGWVLGTDGIRTKAGKELKLTAVTMKNSELERALEILTGQWRTLGVAIDTKVVDANDKAQGVVSNILQPRNFDILLYQLNIGGDPDMYAYWHSSQANAQGFNFANYSNVISDDVLLSARLRSDVALRNAKYITFAKQWLLDVPAIGLYQSTSQYVSSRNVSSVTDANILISPIDRYANILDWTVGSRSVYKTP